MLIPFLLSPSETGRRLEARLTFRGPAVFTPFEIVIGVSIEPRQPPLPLSFHPCILFLRPAGIPPPSCQDRGSPPFSFLMFFGLFWPVNFVRRKYSTKSHSHISFHSSSLPLSVSPVTTLISTSETSKTGQVHLSLLATFLLPATTRLAQLDLY